MYILNRLNRMATDRKFRALLAASLISFSGFSQSTLEIEVTGIRNNTGVIMLQLFDEHETVLRQEKGVILENKCLIIIKDLHPGKYAIRFFHDENLNGTLETTKIGKPTEGYGFSNNAYGMFGPKPFKDWLFEVKEDTKLALKTKY
jgi:uncharacterized protein (DUF2141 family)